MYHPDKYQEHNEALDRLCTSFNKVAEGAGNQIYMESSKIENFIDDGMIVYVPTNNKILYDFEKGHKYYDNCDFPFSDFGQFERKIKKPEILLSIQCSKDEKCFCIAWHEDFKKEKLQRIGSITGSGDKEYSGKRFTTNFKEFKYDEMDIFYEVLLKAFTSNTFNSSCFQI